MDMESEKILVPRDNPKTVPFTNSARAVPNDLPQTPILDRFRALLRQREEEARVSGAADDDVPPMLSTEEVVQLYQLVLAELTFNSKPIITDLTIIAGELREHGEGIADAICGRIIKVPVKQKLPSLYLLDSIVKNIGREYIRYFSSRLPEVFCEAYRQVHPDLYPSMRHLFGTWSTVFPPSVLRKIETQLQFSPQINNQSSGLTSSRASESPRPAHGIHVNPKYLRQLEPPNADNAEVIFSRVGSQRLQKTGVGRATFELGTSRLLPSPTSRLVRPSSPSSIVAERPLNSEVGDFATGSSPQRFAEGASPSSAAFDYGLGRNSGRDEYANEWSRKHLFDDNMNRFETPVAYRHNKGDERQELRALINAYGEDRGNRIPKSKSLQIEHLDVNGLGSKRATRSWQNIEEEEFDWEDMSPTLTDHGKMNDFLPSFTPPFGSDGARPGFGRRSSVLQGTDIRSKWSSQAQLPYVEDSSDVAEDVVPTLGSGRGLTGKMPTFEKERTQVMASRQPQEAWNPSHRLPQSTHVTNAKSRGKYFQIPFSRHGISSSGSENFDLVDKIPDTDSQLVRPINIASRMSSGIVSNTSGSWSGVVLPSTGVRPEMNLHVSHPRQVHPSFPPQKQSRNQFDPMNASNIVLNHSLQKSSLLPDQQFNSLESKDHSLIKQPPIPNQFASLNQQNQIQVNPLHPQILPSQEAQESFTASAVASVPPPMNHGYSLQGQGGTPSMFPLNPVPNVRMPFSANNISNTLRSQMGLRPPLLPSLPPSQMIPIFPNTGAVVSNQPPGNAFSGLFSSLMAQGVISLTKQTPVQDSVGLEFNADLLKVRHESAISALYADLPRQCTTCGLRFKCQEEHSSHMDWHVTKNRMSKSRKQKPSRKWFVSSSMWLTGAEALASDAVPGFLPTESIVERTEDEEMAVPADEEQNACALCGEPFDDFYSDETEEWMYRGAVYLNAFDASGTGMDRSQLGPIVHAKCRSDSSVAPPEGFGHDEGGNFNDDGPRKRKRH